VDVTRNILKYGKRNGLPAVLAHGDLWACNMLVQKDENGKPTGDLLTLIDWQTAHAGFVVEDIARVLVTSVKGEMRRKETDGVLQYYFEELRANLAKHGKECSITLTTIRDAYELNFPYAAAFFLLIVPMMATGATNVDENGKVLDSFANEMLVRSKLVFEEVIELKDKNLW
jgi:aminoglycoside phosphotransferase (APT) family kinase protein